MKIWQTALASFEQGSHMGLSGGRNYVAANDLEFVVNATISRKPPRLVKGELRTGDAVLTCEAR